MTVENESLPAIEQCTDRTHKLPGQTLRRSAMLKHKTDIETLFRTGKKNNFDFIRVVYKKHPQESEHENVRIFVSAPKKYLHHAIDRNTTKRRMREAIRKNLADLRKASKENGMCVDIAFVFQSNILHNYSEIEQIIVLSLQKIYSDIYEDK